MNTYTYHYWGDSDSIEMESPQFQAANDHDAMIMAAKDVGDSLECLFCWKKTACGSLAGIPRAIFAFENLTDAEEILYCVGNGVYPNPNIPSK